MEQEQTHARTRTCVRVRARACPHPHPHPLTRSTAVHQCPQGPAVLPVSSKVVDGQVGHLVLDPAQQTLLGGQLLGVLVLLVLPHGHGDGVVQDERPDHAEDQLQVPVHDGFAVYSGAGSEEERSQWKPKETAASSQTLIDVLVDMPLQ